ncbi:hypothetical protein LB515_24675 [Mesorhizobium sp. CA15]|uniref:hypothetical protein n=1 Tax=Mesorhizobium sp. CA15 TaxID=2876641 RepID=UPI001CD1303C|nr:hypothetical protein [Mesorhizobium sp. CA15]MBZ9868580.1 hypothetical protein [Mesorhizobium sp. CA15]
MRKDVVGIHRRIGTDGAPNSAWVSSEGVGERISEDEYRARGYLPEFDYLPVLIVQRVPVTSADDDQDREIIEEWIKNNNAHRT